MKKFILIISIYLMMLPLITGCGRKKQEAEASELPQPVQVVHEGTPDTFRIDNPEQYPLVKVQEYSAPKELTVTGTVSPDISRNVPVISLSSGRVVEVFARLGDMVKKGQLLLKVKSADISVAYSDYRQAMADSRLVNSQYERARVLYERGAIARKDLEVAEGVASKAGVVLETSAEKLKILGVDNLDHQPSGIVDIYAPISGYIVEQNVANAGGVKTLDNSPNLFTIANLEHVWIVCDVFENDLPLIRPGEYADVRLNAYPDRRFRGRISNIGAVLDPAIRTAKVRLEMTNPGIMRIGMFVTATFYSHQNERHAKIPAGAILHLHDRDWVYMPTGVKGEFRRVEVTGGKMLTGSMQEVSGIEPGRQIVANALVLQFNSQH